MCVILFSWQPHAEYPLVVAANRDEFHDRATEPACWRGQVCCGLDGVAGGTWMGVTAGGRFAALTNYREPHEPVAPRSRGLLPYFFLRGDHGPKHFLETVNDEQHHYAGFNLLVGDRDQLWYFSNRETGPPQPVSPGVHGLSNGLLDEPWPKVDKGCRRLAEVIRPEPRHTDLLAIVRDTEQPPDHALPDTGVGLATERLVAPIFIRTPYYGTRASTSVILPRQGEPELREQRWDRQGQPLNASLEEV
jgi:uncharacterized protein with NRDE domain